MALPPKGNAPIAEEISLLEIVYVRIADEGRMTVVGVPIGTEEYVLERAMEVMKDERAASLTGQVSGGRHRHRIPRAEYKLPRKESGHGTVSRSFCTGADNGAQRAYEKTLKLLGAAGAQSFFRRGARIIG